MLELTNKNLIGKIEVMEETITKLKIDLSINKQVLSKMVKAMPTEAIAVADLPAISDDEISENPQVILEHATGTKRGYLSQLLEQAPGVAYATETEIGGFKYAIDGTKFTMILGD